SFKPNIACILNINRNHLDRHKNMKEYIDSKSKIFKNQTINQSLILNINDTYSKKFIQKTNSKIYYFGNKKNEKTNAYLEKDNLYVEINDKKEKICEIKNIKLIGKHNLENILSVCIMSKLLNVKNKYIKEVLNEFKGLPHRLELVSCYKNIFFINDSKATTVDAVKKAIRSFNQPIILIMGGINKGGNFSLLKPEMKKVKKCILIGKSKNQIKKMIENFVSCKEAISLKEAVKIAWLNAKPNDCVLLSPGCSSFDMFQNFEERGNVFKKLVTNLK
ncbi:MAG: UDP-N-acetylmuramoyl-L-alanine--D-glutamate ligase, partial [bacterium]